MHLSLSRGAVVRVLPFALFLALLALRGMLPNDGSTGIDPRWIYGVGVVVVGAALWWYRRDYGELAVQMRPDGREAGLAVGVGLVVFGLWIALDAPWMQLGEPAATFMPLHGDGRIDWPLVAVRWIGAALLVPVMEELFWRSFLMRWFERPQFETVMPQRVSVKAIALSTFVFTLVHTLWLAAVVAGLAYAWLYVRTGKLWVPIIAHAVTNGVLGVWVVATGNWSFW
ncbi:MAG TPA: CAAX prenyl protease-related protein [Albitalea sp.]|uniref:CAAX prenyl protease-related protein n=1 Tax=Piscinibacter sp. TaxID=1903157 RepID=UPI002ED107F0